jgi:hypothetical protein
MKLSLLLACLLGFVAVSYVQADALQDQINASLKKFCGGIAVTAPSKGQSFSNPKKITVTVSKVIVCPDSTANIMSSIY